MTSRDEAIRALEKAVELVAKATKGPWAFMNEKFDDCLLAFGTDSLDYDAPPPWYSCWTSINPDDGRAIIAAVNFIREHGAAILSARQEVAPVVLARGFFHRDEQDEDGDYEIFGAKDDRCEKCIPCLIVTESPAHTSEARDAARYRWLRDAARTTDFDTPRWTVSFESGGWGETYRGETLDKHIDAAMEGGNG